MLRFSIIIPNYNKEKYIKKCLDSIVTQTLDKSKYEIILIDDGSTDNSLDIIKEYDVKLLRTHRLRAGGARNKGLDNALGEYIIFIDSDDYLSNNDVLEKLDNKINGEDIIYLNFTKIDFDGSSKLMSYNKDSLNDKIARSRFLGPPSKCFKNNILNDIRFVEKSTYEDVSFTLNALCECKSEAYFEESFYNYIKVDNSLTTEAVGAKQMTDLIIQITSLYYLCEDYPQYKKSLLFRIENDKLKERLDILNTLIKTGKNTFREHFPIIK
ncbi:MAG: glycosyltransferase family 2 protein [Clostridia bacterium]|nr:glycosyltransferase family 2 protein [Clostridia bacterium]MDD4375228.1 glycosyltransferase family 2 protein [Clostridia bacterium]